MSVVWNGYRQGGGVYNLVVMCACSKDGQLEMRNEEFESVHDQRSVLGNVFDAVYVYLFVESMDCPIRNFAQSAVDDFGNG